MICMYIYRYKNYSFYENHCLIKPVFKQIKSNRFRTVIFWSPNVEFTGEPNSSRSENYSLQKVNPRNRTRRTHQNEGCVGAYLDHPT